MNKIDRLFTEAHDLATQKNLDLLSAINLIDQKEMESIKKEINSIIQKINEDSKDSD